MLCADRDSIVHVFLNVSVSPIFLLEGHKQRGTYRAGVNMIKFI
jgi:hypothetical protein